MQNALKEGEFLNFTDLPVLVELFENYPTALFDGEFFVRNISSSETDDDVAQGRVRAQDKIGNDCADVLASAAAWRNRTHPAVRHSAKQRKELTVRVQSMMLDIAIARQESLKPEEEEEAYGVAEEADESEGLISIYSSEEEIIEVSDTEDLPDYEMAPD